MNLRFMAPGLSLLRKRIMQVASLSILGAPREILLFLKPFQDSPRLHRITFEQSASASEFDGVGLCEDLTDLYDRRAR
jgi:hypothetical protein